MVRLHGAEIAMFSVISNVSIFLCLVLFIRKAGRYTNSSLLSERFRWREKQLRDGLSGYISKLFKGLCCFHNFLVCFVELVPRFTATPPDPFNVLEGNNITFVWKYNVSGTFDRVIFRFISSSPARTIVTKPDLDRDAVVSSDYRGRIQENINAIRAEITIFALHRSESGEYEIISTNSNFDTTSDSVTVQVQCK